MKLIFVGSLEKKGSHYATIREQFRKLVAYLVDHNCEFVVRGNSGEDDDFISIDFIVLDILAEIQKQKGGQIRIATFDQVGMSPTQIPSGLLVSNHSDSSDTRAAMYAEINSLVDIVIGVGGRHGLLRHSIACEYMNKPFFPLPGTGGVCDELWADFIRKGKVILHCPEGDRRLIKNAPLANQNSQDYAHDVFNVIDVVQKNALRIAEKESARAEKEEAIDFKKMTAMESIRAVKRLSNGSIGSIVVAIGAIFGAGVTIGAKFFQDSSPMVVAAQDQKCSQPIATQNQPPVPKQSTP